MNTAITITTWFVQYYPSVANSDGTTAKRARVVLMPFGQGNADKTEQTADDDIHACFVEQIARALAKAAGGFEATTRTASNGAKYHRGKAPVDVENLVIDENGRVIGLGKATAHVDSMSLDDLIEAQ